MINATKMRELAMLCWVLGCVAFFRHALGALFSLAIHNSDASHILLIPLISGWLFYVDRQKIQGAIGCDLKTALMVASVGIVLKLFASYGLSFNDAGRLSANVLALLIFLLAGCLACFGTAVVRQTWFSFAFLIFAVPLPDILLNKLIYGLQEGSAAVAELLFDLSGVPVLREGLVFHLPSISIEVAQECSGIRSSMALLILAVLIAHFSFRSFWKKVAFILAGLLIMLVKNGVRIATLTLLANYVDPDFLYGRLHHQGGVVFFLFGLGLLIPVYQLLRRGEASMEEQTTALSSAS